MTPTNAPHAISVLAAHLGAALQRSIRNQRTYVETLSEQTVRDGTVQGTVDVTEGELVATVTFPISFLEKPIFAPGLELADNAWLQFGSFPHWSATVADWVTHTTADSTLYTGARLGILVIGVPNAIVHYSFFGRSLTTAGTVGSSIGSPL